MAAGAVVPHHFIRRGLYDWDDPAKLVGSLVAQIEDGFPELHEPEADEGMHPECWWSWCWWSWCWWSWCWWSWCWRIASALNNRTAPASAAAAAIAPSCH